MCLVLSDEMIDFKLIIILVLCANCVSGMTVNSNGKGKCCVPEEDLEASATFNFPSNEITSAYNTYDPSLRNTPSILDARLNRFGGLDHHGLPVHVQTFGQSPKNNVEIITTYNEKKTGPIYKQSTITRKNLEDAVEKKKTGKKGRYNPEKGPVSYTNVNVPAKSKQYRKDEYEAEKTKHPEENKSLYEETKSEGSESSSFNRGIRYKNSYKEPPTSIIEKLNEDGSSSDSTHTNGGDIDPKFHPRISSGIESTNLESKPKILEKISDQPLQEAGSIGKTFISGDLDSGSLGFIGGGGSLLGDGFGYDKEKHFEKEKGKHYAEAHKKEEGHKSEKDYKTKEAFDKGEEEKHGSHHHKGSGHEQGGKKKGHLDEAKKYTEGHEASKGEKASDFLHKKGHRKGHKKSGFHTVHHKDEFKKDEHFFDEEHDTGEEAAHGHSDHKHAHKHGGEQKEGHHDSGYKEAHHKKQGGKEEGHSHHQHAGHKAEQGHQSHHAQAAEHASKEGHKEAEKHGHSEKHEGHLL